MKQVFQVFFMFFFWKGKFGIENQSIQVSGFFFSIEKPGKPEKPKKPDLIDFPIESGFSDFFHVFLSEEKFEKFIESGFSGFFQVFLLIRKIWKPIDSFQRKIWKNLESLVQ